MPADSGSFPYKVGLYLGAESIANLKSLMCNGEMCAVLYYYYYDYFQPVDDSAFDMFYISDVCKMIIIVIVYIYIYTTQLFVK